MSYELNFEYLLNRLATRIDAECLDQVRLAYDLARSVHATQLRDEGAPYIVHPVRVAVSIVDELKLYSPKLICSALLHDVIEDSPEDRPVTRSHIEESFGDEIAEVVWLLTKLEDVSLHEYLSRIEAARETGAPIVKLCDRLDNMRSVVHSPKLEKKRRYIRTTEELYLPMAERTNRYLHDELLRCLEEARNQVEAIANGL
ncbi:MAG TPA: HD domain-containing protein [Blastocatellia bacterium]|nr:HD domain-containing protein [Blastocatellia bacterium]